MSWGRISVTPAAFLCHVRESRIIKSYRPLSLLIGSTLVPHHAG